VAGTSNRGCGCLGVWAVILAIAAVVWGVQSIYGGIKGCSEDRTLSPFQNHLAAYLAAPASTRPKGDGYVRGRVIAVDAVRRDFDRDVYFALDDDLRASDPEQVGTVVVTEWKTTAVGTYSNGDTGYQYSCRVSVIDRSTNEIVAQSSFTGGDPPSSKKDDGDAYGDKPVEEIAVFVRNLPRE
jgi:hypothetical protein